MEYRIASWRVKKEMDLVISYDNVKPHREAKAWNMINSGQGTTEQHQSYMNSRHDFKWCPEIWEHVCFFSFQVQGPSSEEDDPTAAPPSPVLWSTKIRVRSEREMGTMRVMGKKMSSVRN